MSEEFDKLDREVMEGARSPIAGVDSALAAGAAFRSRPRIKRHVSRELPAYLIVPVSYTHLTLPTSNGV